MLTWFLAGAFGFTWFFHLLIPLLRLPWSGSAAGWLYGIGIAGPLVSAVVVTIRYSGIDGLRALLFGGLKWQVGWPWHLVALVLVGGLYLAGIGLYVLLGGSVQSSLFQTPVGGWLALLMGQIFVVIREEYGWRGLALPLLTERFGTLTAALVLGVIWAAWHLPMFWVPDSHQYGSSFGMYTLIMITFSLMMTALYYRTGGSTLSAMLYHIGLNAAFFVIRAPAGAGRYMLAMHVVAGLAAMAFLPRPWVRL